MACARSATSVELSALALRGVVGQAAATRLLELARGIDDRRVDSERPIKSVSHEETFAVDLHGADALRTELARLADGVASRLRADGLAARTITLKIRDATFQTTTRAKTLPRPIDSAAAITETVHGLLDKSPPAAGVRLLGVAASKFAEPAEQLQLDGIDDGQGAPVERRQQGDRPRPRPFRWRGDWAGEFLVTGRAAGRAPWPAPMGDR